MNNNDFMFWFLIKFISVDGIDVVHFNLKCWPLCIQEHTLGDLIAVGYGKIGLPIVNFEILHYKIKAINIYRFRYDRFTCYNACLLYSNKLTIKRNSIIWEFERNLLLPCTNPHSHIAHKNIFTHTHAHAHK